MFALFFSLYYAMFTGTWTNMSLNTVEETIKLSLNPLGKLLTSIFNDGVTYETFGTDFYYNFLPFVAFILALITSIGIVVMAVKGIKRVFGVFFGLMR